jgi:hypothetical protein
MTRVDQKRRVADIERHLRRQQMRELAPKVRRGDQESKAQYVALLQRDGDHATADLIECAKWSRRGAPARDPFEEVKRYFVAVMRARQKRNGGKFAKGERFKELKQLMTDLAERGDLNCFSNAERDRLWHDVIAGLRRMPRKQVKRR